MSRRIALLIALWGALSTAPVWCDNADAAQRREDQLKAGYLFNFAKFVEWPASTPNDALTVCFVGASGIQEALAMDSSDKRIGTRKLSVRSLHESEAPAGCNVLYVDAKLAEAVRSNVGSIQQPTLTVSDAKDFTRDGGIITLYTENNRLRFIVNVRNAQRVGLHISSNLLQLASTVEKAGPP
jgi:YfiR/HmsC-like